LLSLSQPRSPQLPLAHLCWRNPSFNQVSAFPQPVSQSVLVRHVVIRHRMSSAWWGGNGLLEEAVLLFTERCFRRDWLSFPTVHFLVRPWLLEVIPWEPTSEDKGGHGWWQKGKMERTWSELASSEVYLGRTLPCCLS
jgi:hypothetical protein